MIKNIFTLNYPTSLYFYYKLTVFSDKQKFTLDYFPGISKWFVDLTYSIQPN